MLVPLCGVVLTVFSSFAIILMRKRELVSHLSNVLGIIWPSVSLHGDLG